jgi:hypothetical protein
MNQYHSLEVGPRQEQRFPVTPVTMTVALFPGWGPKF